jgi:hypothetical protein
MQLERTLKRAQAHSYTPLRPELLSHYIGIAAMPAELLAQSFLMSVQKLVAYGLLERPPACILPLPPSSRARGQNLGRQGLIVASIGQRQRR